MNLDTLDPTEHPQWIVSALLALLSWLGRRRIGRLWRWSVNQGRMNARVTALEEEVRECKAQNLYLMTALKQLTEAGQLVRQAHQEGLIQTISPGSNAPSNSPES